jgi:hypothetical protein
MGTEALAAKIVSALDEVPKRPVYDAERFILLRSSHAARAAGTKEPALTWDRKNAARHAYLGDKHAFDRWYLLGDARSQAYILATAAQIAGTAIEDVIEEGVHLCLIRDEARAWLEKRGVAIPPEPPRPPPADLATYKHGEADEFGFVFLPRAAAAQLAGEDDHTRLTEHVDPLSAEPNAVSAYGANGFLFCRTYDVGMCFTPDGAFLTYGSDETEMRKACAEAAERRWMPLTTVTGPLVGLPAMQTLEEYGKPFELNVPPGEYEVKTAIQMTEDDVPLLWLRKI